MACEIMEVEPHTGVIGKVSGTCKHQLVKEITVIDYINL